jgi:hypothetical protein
MWIEYVGFLPKGASLKLSHIIRCLLYLGSSFPRKSIWSVNAPSRVVFFVWMTILEKILTLDNLRKRNVIVVDWCCMCKNSEESIDLLLLHSEVERDFWSSLFNLFGVWVMPRRVRELLVSWRG